MTEQNKENRKIFLNLCKTVWDFDEKSLKYLEERTNDDWRPVEDFNKILDGQKFEDQRIVYNLNLSDPSVQELFMESDEAFKMFNNAFSCIIDYLKEKYSCVVGYNEFITNKCIFRKNVTKIKKVFETVYAENHSAFESDAERHYSEEDCTEYIVKKFERIGASKKSAKKLQMVISFNPIDWLMSSTAEDWSSCFNLNNTSSGGFQYCLGLPFLAGDKNRMMIYITDGSIKECMGIKVNHFQTRTWALLGNDNLIHIVKWYPNNTVGVKPVTSITKVDMFSNNSSYSESKYPLDVLSTKKGAVINVYSDMGEWKERDGKLINVGNGKEGQQVFTKNLININKIHGDQSINLSLEAIRYRTLGARDIGYKIPEWKKLGIHLDLFFSSLVCSNCGEDKTGVRLNDGSFICYDCYKDNIFSCGHCGKEFLKNSTSAHKVKLIGGGEATICDSCYNDKERYTCSCCGGYNNGDYELFDTDEGNLVCDSCVKSGRDGYKKCDTCGKVSKNITIKYNSFEKTVYRCCNEHNFDDELAYVSFGKYMYIAQKSKKQKEMSID